MRCPENPFQSGCIYVEGISEPNVKSLIPIVVHKWKRTPELLGPSLNPFMYFHNRVILFIYRIHKKIQVIDPIYYEF
jgi:hypothetical protein